MIGFDAVQAEQTEQTAIPTTYEGADKIGADGRGALAGARLVWDGLTPAMKRWLGDARFIALAAHSGGHRLPRNTTRGTSEALVARGLTRSGGWLTPLGLLVRECGTRTRTGADRG